MIQNLDNIDLKPYNTFGLSAIARKILIYDSPHDLPMIFSGENSPKHWLHIGDGSNLLFCSDYDGVILKSHITDMAFEPLADGKKVMATIGSGVSLAYAIEAAVSCNLWGIENLAGIPGQTGAAAVQNVGAYGVEIADIIHSVECFDTATRSFVSFNCPECAYGYRQSRFKSIDKGRYIVTAVKLLLSKIPKPVLTYGPLKSLSNDASLNVIIDRVIATRSQKLPAVDKVGSAGSFFKNPIVTPEVYNHIVSKSVIKPTGFNVDVNGRTMVKLSAAWLIDQAGLKGISHKGAATWPMQPLVIVNSTGHANATDIIELEQIIIDKVNEKFNIILSPEVEHITNPQAKS